MTSDSCSDVQCRVCTQCQVLYSNEKVNYHQHISQCQESSDSVLLCPPKDFGAYKKFFPLRLFPLPSLIQSSLRFLTLYLASVVIRTVVCLLYT